MQSKGSLGSVVSGVIAIFMVLVCLFYLSFSFVGNHYDNEAKEYALKVAGNSSSEKYGKAVKTYVTDSLGNKPLYLGYNYNEIQKWGIGLGLDLKGGMNVILQVSMPDMLRSMTSLENDTTFNSALEATDKVIKSHQSEDFVGTFVKEYKQRNPVADFSVIFPEIIKQGDSDEKVAQTIKDEVKDRVNNSATNVLRSRIDAFGVVSPNIQVLQGKDGQILLELPGVTEHERVRELLQRSANLEFYETYFGSEIASYLDELDKAIRTDSVNGNSKGFWANLNEAYPSQQSPIIGAASQGNRDIIDAILASPAAKRILPSNLKLAWEVKAQPQKDRNGEDTGLELFTLYALKTNNGKARLAGDCVVGARSDYDNTRKMNVVSMNMNSEGAKQWARVTKDNIGKCVAVTMDGNVYSAPTVNQVIEGGRSEISGSFTVEEAQDLANVLKSGKMTAKVDIISDLVVGPSLGQEAIEDGFTSFVAALILLMIFMVSIYGIAPGMIANMCLVFNLFFTLGILASFQAVLTMSGIAGIVLTLGMAVDANVLIFERTKEELRNGKNVKTAIADGYSNAFSAIFDSNLTSVITGVILLYYGTGPIKGFATTYIIGLACSFFTAVYLSRLVFMAGSKSKWLKNLTFTTPISRKMFSNTKINFLGQRKVSAIICGLVIIATIASFALKGMNQGIDFSGGRNYIVKFEKPVVPSELQAKLAPEFEGASVSVITIENSNQVRISTNYKINEEAPEIEKEITDKLFKVLKSDMKPGMTEKEFSTSDENQGILQSQKVGPSVADDMRTSAYIAVALSLIAMFIYILVRFHNIAFSVGALAAVAFTAFTIIGFYSMFWGVLPFAMEIDQTFIAAILTVIGYQINDTVVVFDRVRENIGLYPKQDFFTTVNSSINQTLSRTIMTSGTTLLVLICIFILGGDAIRSFTFAMLFGVITGTLATIYVASPVAYLIDKKRHGKKAA